MHLFDIWCLFWVKFDVRDIAHNSVEAFVSIVKISAGKIILFEWMQMKLRLSVCHKTVWHLESKDYLGKVCVWCQGVHHLQFCYTGWVQMIVTNDLLLLWSSEVRYGIQICSYLMWFVQKSDSSASCLSIWMLHLAHLLHNNPYPTAFPYGNGIVLHFYQQQESSMTKTVHKVINKRLKTYV